jgi:uncharacterized protein
MTEYHEPLENLPEKTRDLHRALKSLMEELEAVDWYSQRVAATKDEDLRAVLTHHADEEIEHACMLLELLRRREPKWDANLRKYLFTTAPITDVEKGAGTSGLSDGDLGLRDLGRTPSRQESRDETPGGKEGGA